MAQCISTNVVIMDLDKKYEELLLEETLLNAHKQSLLARVMSAYCEKYQTDVVEIPPTFFKLTDYDFGTEIVSIYMASNGKMFFKDTQGNCYEENKIVYGPMMLIGRVLQQL